MGTVIVLAILVVAVFFGVRSSLKHMKGQGGCCGGGDEMPKIKKKKLQRIVTTKVISIEGMTCKNCSQRVENALNAMDDVNAIVNLRKKQAVVKLGSNVSDEDLEKVILRAGYTVREIKEL